MKTFGNKAKVKLSRLPWRAIALLLLTVLFFSFTIVITYDGGHYLNYVAIFEKEAPWSSWDIVRGPVFPVIIFLSDKLFGKTSTGILVMLFLFYIVFSVLVYICTKELTRNLKKQRLIQNIVTGILILNPLIFGYFHVLLTEFVALTVMMLCVYAAYRWLFVEKTRRNCWLFFAFWAIIVAFCYHLKQPYLTISFFPLVIATIMSIVREHKKKNVLINLGMVIGSLVFLAITIFAWGKIIDRMGTDKNTGRDSSSIFGMQLLDAGQITVDEDGDGENDTISMFGALNLIGKKFAENPLGVAKIYLQNYCGLISMCKITTNNGHNFISTGELTPFTLYENEFISYQVYRESDGISPMKEGQYERALKYQSNIDRGSFATLMFYLEKPTTALFKLSFLLYPVAIIVILVVRRKDRSKKNDRLYCFSLVTLFAAFAHLIASSTAGLIIDRYSIEAFVPAVMGILGTIRYCYIVRNSRNGKEAAK